MFIWKVFSFFQHRKRSSFEINLSLPVDKALLYFYAFCFFKVDKYGKKGSTDRVVSIMNHVDSVSA